MKIKDIIGKKCIFLDRDGVLNIERGEYTFHLEDFVLEYRITESLNILKQLGYLLVIITNQAGIAKGLYTRKEVLACHQKLQLACSNAIDALYYSPYHPNFSTSLSRKPDSLLFEKAISKFNINPQLSYMVGDKERDLIPAKKLNINTVIVNNASSEMADYSFKNLFEFSQHISKVIKN